MKPAELLGVSYTLGRQVAIPILLVAFIALAFYKTGKDARIIPCVINTIGPSKVQYLNCDPNDLNANKEVLVDTSKRLLNVLFNYDREATKRYASQYDQFKHFIANYSPSASKVKDYVLRTIDGRKGPIMHESSSISINYDSFQSLLENDLAYITLDATRDIQRAQGTDRENIRIDITYKIGEGINEIYHIYDFAITYQ